MPEFSSIAGDLSARSFRAIGMIDPTGLSGKGVEWFYNTDDDYGGIQAIDRTTGLPVVLQIGGKNIRIVDRGFVSVETFGPRVGIGGAEDDEKSALQVKGVVALRDTAEPDAPAGGCLLYSDGGVLKVKNTAGAVMTLNA